MAWRINQSHTRQSLSPDVEEVVITLQDDQYPVSVKLHYVAYRKENVIITSATRWCLT